MRGMYYLWIDLILVHKVYVVLHVVETESDHECILDQRTSPA
jgi:hypothetical protein